jgi:GGDEF domain-containing protein
MVTADASEYRIGRQALDDSARADYDALFDRSTHLPTRALLYDRLLMALARTQRTGTSVGVIFIRPDGPMDEQAFLTAAETVVRTVRVDDTVARTGAAELVVVCHLRDGQEARVVVRRLAQELRAERGLRSMTVGFASGGRGDDPGELLYRAAGAIAVPLGDALAAVPVHLPRSMRPWR